MPKNLNDKIWFKECLNNKDLISKIEKIKLVITDVDGCLTNGTIDIGISRKYFPMVELLPTNKHISKFYDLILSWLATEKNLDKNFSTQDGFAINKTLESDNLKIAFLSGRRDEATSIRADMLGVPQDMCFIGIHEKKINIVKNIQENKNISIDETLYFGDDYLDFETKPSIGLFACPINTPFYFKDASDLIIPKKGGQHAFRLLLDLVLYVQKKHFAQEFIKNSLR